MNNLDDFKIGKSLLVSAFPGTGKSYYCYNGNYSQYYPSLWCTDSDSSKFDKLNFPQNYIEHIRSKISEGYARIFISSHKDVRNALIENNLPFVLVYPAIELKEEYLKRYLDRGSNDSFIRQLEGKWSEWITDCANQQSCFKIELKSGEYLSNAAGI